MRKAQITAFMLLGIVIIGTFGFVFYIGRHISDVQFQKKIDRIVNDIIQNTPVNFYVTQCLDDSLREGLYLVGRQGGFIFPYQEGTVLVGPLGNVWYNRAFQNNNYIEYDGFNVTYLIQRHKIEGNYNDVPYYPCRGNPTSDNFCRFRNPIGDTPPFSFGASPYFFNNYLLEKPKEPPRPISVEEQLENYVSYHVKNCVNFTSIGKRLGYDITEGNVTTTVTLGNIRKCGDDVSANVKFPIIISFQNREPVTKMFDFYGQEYVRLCKIYNILKHLIDPDNLNADLEQTNLTFDINESFWKLPQQIIGGITLKTIKNQVDYEPAQTLYNDVFILNDSFSTLGGDNFYIFQFARQNRIPVLDYICDDNTNIQLDCPKQIPQGSGNWYDITIPAENNISIWPKANDPDEDELYFNYSGWRETVNETWNNTKYDELADSPDNCTWNPRNCVDVIAGEPHDWTSSNSDWELGYKVEYETRNDDIGAHYLNVSVRDYNGSGGLLDWQTVRILVVDHPRASAGNSRNNYSDIDNRRASIEDIYWLSAEASVGKFCKPWNYWWQDDSEITNLYGEEHTLYRGELVRVGLPFNQFSVCFDSSCFDIRDMTGEFNNYSSPLTDYGPKEHHINLTITATQCGIPQVDTAEWKVNVTVCLPHRSNAAPYPYNDVEENRDFNTGYTGTEPDSFQGNHTCCSTGDEWGNYTTRNECYRFESYSCKPDVGKEYYPANLTVNDSGEVQAILYDTDSSLEEWDIEEGRVYSNLMDVYNDDSSNDIYKRVFSQKCSGYRGNACSGVFTDEWILETECLDILDPGQDERCQGPCPPNDPDCKYDYGLNYETCDQRNESYGCYNYNDGKSFEKTYLNLSWADGICNNNWKVSDKYDIEGYNKSGRYLCQAACGSGVCRTPIKCKLIDEYDYKIPINDTPWHIEGRDYESGDLPATDTIYGYTGTSKRTGISVIHTIIPPPSPEIPYPHTWCDGRCFSIGGTETSPTFEDHNGMDTCTARDYYPQRVDDSTDINDTINFTVVDIDKDETWCNACNTDYLGQNTKWIHGGESLSFGEYGDNEGSNQDYGNLGYFFGLTECCGDDSEEYANTCNNEYNGYNPSNCNTQNICCRERTDCVNTTGACLTEGSCYNFGGKPAYCEVDSGVGVWRDPDEDEGYCKANGCGFEWIVDKCCGDDGSDDDWISSDASKACDDGSLNECDTLCDRIYIRGRTYYCDGTVWVKKDGAAGVACGNGVCTLDGCCGDEAGENIVYDAEEDEHYCGCKADYYGLGCEELNSTDVNAEGSFNQEGICASDGNDVICDINPPAVNYMNTIYSECSWGYGYGCDNVLTDGLFSAEGTCLEDNTCCTGFAISIDGDTNPDVCDKSCDDVYIDQSINYYCDIVSDGGWNIENKECDNTTGQGCIICEGLIDDSDNCEVVCGADRECDELLPGTQICNKGANESYCTSDCSYIIGDGLCDTNCGAEEGADEENPNSCAIYGPGYVDGDCKYFEEADDRKEACGCITNNDKDYDELWDYTDTKCCDGSDYWVFHDNASKACIDGSLNYCDTPCKSIYIEGTIYYCDGSQWAVGDATGQSCNNGAGVCDDDGVCIACDYSLGKELEGDNCEVVCGANINCSNRQAGSIVEELLGWCCDFDGVSCKDNNYGCQWCAEEFVDFDNNLKIDIDDHCGCLIGQDDGRWCDINRDRIINIAGEYNRDGKCNATSGECTPI